MELYHKALDLFENGNYLDAKNIFHKIINESNLQKDILIDSLQKLILITNLQDSSEEKILLLQLLGNIYIEIEDFEKAALNFESVLNIDSSLTRIKNKSDFFKKVIWAYRQTGAIQKASDLSVKFYDYCLKRKYASVALEFIDNGLKVQKSNIKSYIYKLKFLFIKHDVENIKSTFNQLFENNFAQKNIKNYVDFKDDIRELIQLMAIEGLAAKLPEIYNELILTTFINDYEIEYTVLGYCRKIEKNIYQAILKIFLELLIINQNKRVLELLLRFLVLAQEKDFYYKVLNYVKRIGLSSNSKYQEIKHSDNLADEIGFKYDFLKENISLPKKNKKKLINNKEIIYPLKNEKELEDYLAASTDYESDRKNNIQTSEFYFCKQIENGYFDLNEYKDYFSILYSLSFYKACQMLLSLKEKELSDNDHEGWIELFHFKALTFLGMKCYDESIAVIEHIFKMYSLSPSEQINFYYLKGEVYERMGNYDLAYDNFMMVNMSESSYRDVKNKLRKIKRTR